MLSIVKFASPVTVFTNKYKQTLLKPLAYLYCVSTNFHCKVAEIELAHVRVEHSFLYIGLAVREMWIARHTDQKGDCY